jgi:argininosuccinate lyase
MKGLPLAYNRDMQEDKEPLFDTVDTVTGCLHVLNKMMPRVRFNKKKMLDAAIEGFSTATDIAEYLVKKGMPFRDAHGVTGSIVTHCIDNGLFLTDLTTDELKDFSDFITSDISDCISVSGSVDGRMSYGGTAQKVVRARIKKIKSKK